jgi:hypothetical protein
MVRHTPDVLGDFRGQPRLAAQIRLIVAAAGGRLDRGTAGEALASIWP